MNAARGERPRARASYPAMPRYFFNTVDGRRHLDEDGTDLPDQEAVRRKATLVIGELLKERPTDLWDTGRLRLEVADETGEAVLVVEVSADQRNRRLSCVRRIKAALRAFGGAWRAETTISPGWSQSCDGRLSPWSCVAGASPVVAIVARAPPRCIDTAGSGGEDSRPDGGAGDHRAERETAQHAEQIVERWNRPPGHWILVFQPDRPRATKRRLQRPG